MSSFANYSVDEKRRIKALACRLVEGQIENGTIACADEAIRAAMPNAIEDARLTIAALDEYLCG